MTTAAEASTAKTPLGAALDAGVATLSYDQQITFTLYLRVVLPADGFVFWVQAGLLNKNSAAYNNALYNKAQYNAPGQSFPQATEFSFKGSLHYTTQVQQNEADSAATRSVTFTARQPVNNLDAIGPNMMWVAEYADMKFAFRERQMFYRQSGLHHYRGVALYSTLASQLIDSTAQLPTGNVVSNSLPLWLTMNQYAPVYPSFAIPPNLEPPYIGVHVVPAETESFAMGPYIDPSTSSSWELCRDTVRFTLYGLQNQAAVLFKNYILAGSMAQDDASPYGILGTRFPAVQDERQTQPEMQILAQRKTFTVAVSYLQQQISDIVQKYILHAMLDLTIGTVPN
jgi:hypothetical protein